MQLESTGLTVQQLCERWECTRDALAERMIEDGLRCYRLTSTHVPLNVYVSALVAPLPEPSAETTETASGHRSTGGYPHYIDWREPTFAESLSAMVVPRLGETTPHDPPSTSTPTPADALQFLCEVPVARLLALFVLARAEGRDRDLSFGEHRLGH